MKGKAIIIIGVGTGVSAAVAHKFGSMGFDVALIARNTDKLTTLESSLKNKGIGFKSFKSNAAVHSKLSASLREVMRNFPSIDVLHYNVAALRREPILQDEVHHLEQDFVVNVSGAFNATQTILPHMQDKKEGTILFTGGVFAKMPDPNFASLGIGKAGLRNLTYSLHAALKPQNIHVGMVSINGFVSENSPIHTPTAIAELFWKHYKERKKVEYEL